MRRILSSKLKNGVEAAVWVLGVHLLPPTPLPRWGEGSRFLSRYASERVTSFATLHAIAMIHGAKEKRIPFDTFESLGGRGWTNLNIYPDELQVLIFFMGSLSEYRRKRSFKKTREPLPERK